MSVYANGREVSGKAQPNKVIAGFPSVCMSPPSPPAGPVPIPYPMFTDASKTSGGTGSVKIKKKEVGKKNASTWAKSKGNEPATRSFGMDVASHTLTGASKHQAYSFDVLFEKAGAERFMDLTTTNHGSDPATAVATNTAGGADSRPPSDPECEALRYQNALFRGAVANDCPADLAADVNQNHTVASGTYTDPASGTSSYTGTSCTNQLAQTFDCLAQPLSASRDRWVSVIVGNDEDGEPIYRNHLISLVCHNCSQPIGGQQCHAELNILNDIGRNFGSGPGGKVLLAIDWISNGIRQAPQPCSNCQNRIECFCSEECIKIIICDEDGQPVDRCEQPYERA